MIERTAGDATHWHKKVLPVCIAVLALLMVIAAIFLILKLLDSKPSNHTISKTIRKQADFTLYYPTNTPSGYKIVENSEKLASNDTFFYEIRSNQGSIVVSQQTMPDNPPQLDKLEGFRKLSLSIGDAVIGKSAEGQTAIILTNSTLIIIRGSTPDIPSSVISDIAANLQPLN